MGKLYKGICFFPTIFRPEPPKGSDVPKFSVTLAFPPNDPQVNDIWAIQEQAKMDSFPSGLPHNANVCFMGYDEMFQGREYYDPRFSGWWVLACSAKQEDKPVIIDGNHTPILDPSTIYSGCIIEVFVNISGYKKGKGGVGAWMNGVRFCGEVGQFGRLDGRPSTEQMFGQSAPGHQQPAQGGPGQYQQPAQGGPGQYQQPAQGGPGQYQQPAQGGPGQYQQPAQGGPGQMVHGVPTRF